MITYCGTGCGMSMLLDSCEKMRTVLLFGFLILFNHLSSLPKLYYFIILSPSQLRPPLGMHMRHSDSFHNLYSTSIHICCMPSEQYIVSIRYTPPGQTSQRLWSDTPSLLPLKFDPQNSNSILSSTFQLEAGMQLSDH